MPATISFRLATLAFFAGAVLAGAYTALGPALNLDGGLPAPAKPVIGGAYFGAYGPLYARITGAYSPMPPPPEYSRDWPPPSPPTDDRGYASCEALGAYVPGGPAALGPGLYYSFKRGERDYHKFIYGPTIESWMENYVAFKHDALAVAAYRLRVGGKGTAVLWGGAGVSHFRRRGLYHYWWSDFYNPEYIYEETICLDTRLTALAAGAGGDLRSGFARHYGFNASLRAVFLVADLSRQGYDGDNPTANAALALGFFVGW